MNSKLLAAGLLVLLLSGCWSTRILPTPRNIGKSPYGAVAKVYPLQNIQPATGELIAVDSSRLYLLDHRVSELLIIERSDIRKYSLDVAHTAHMLWVPLVYSMASVFHGSYSIVSLPFNLFTTLVITQTGYSLKSSNISYEELSKFARFPKGLTEEHLLMLNVPSRVYP